MRPVTEDEGKQLDHIVESARNGTLAAMTVRNKVSGMDEVLIACVSPNDDGSFYITPLAILKHPDDLYKLYDPGEDVEASEPKLDLGSSTGASTSHLES